MPHEQIEDSYHDCEESGGYMSILDNDNESPTVKRLQRERDNATERAAKMEALLLDVCGKYMMQVNDKFAGEFSTRVNAITGRV